MAVSPRNAPAERASVSRNDETPRRQRDLGDGPFRPNSVAATRTIA
jgi:hypothetical protein